MVDHAWVQENLDTYLTAELTTSEREDVELHAATCEACKQALTEARKLAQVMNGLFCDARPDAHLDNRIVQELRKEPGRTFQRPTLWRCAMVAASVLIVGLVGLVAQAFTSEGGFTFADKAFDALPRATTAIPVDSVAKSRVAELQKEYENGEPDLVDSIQQRLEGLEMRGAGVNDRDKDKEIGKEQGLTFEAAKVLAQRAASEDTKKKVFDMDYYMRTNTPGYTAPAASANPGLQNGDVKLKILYDTRDSYLANLESTKDKESKELRSITNSSTFYPSPNVTTATKGTKQLEDLMKVARDRVGKDDAGEKGEKGDKMLALDKTTLEDQAKARLFPLMPPKGTMGPMAGLRGFYYKPGDASVTPTSGPPPGGGPMPKKGPGDVFAQLSPPPSLPASPPADPKYFGGEKTKSKGGAKKGFEPKGEFPAPSTKETPPSPVVPASIAGGDEKKKDDGGKVPDGGQKPSDAKVPPKQIPEEPPLETNRKIIRTGEMDFEVDSFDKAIDNITRLITGVKGGFVATANSDKLPNGKMRGSIVVRMPPQFLDKFVLDLRRELAKSGELKNQRISSLDVTKQYTDIESRLRAARTIEERLIQIIKTGKGEIKDLVAAERELGVWRTKIEEMEGEIRYYGNQVSLSTLTITLTEKEILAPTAIVMTESVRMRLEVEDVAKSHQLAMTAVEELKGRITRSELKQHSAGQLQSILQADIPPAQKNAFRDRLSKLGIVADHEENQSQHTEGGVGKSGDLKPRQNDVRFDIQMHNTANVRPRLTADLKIATSDVPEAYARLLAEITKVKGQVRDGKLNEQDKLNITATIDFNVPTSEKPAIDKLLLDIGPVLERVNMQTPVSELSTDRKFGYTLLLRDFASIPPSKSATDIIAVLDVPAVYAKLQDEITKIKGQFIDAKLNEQDKLNINAQIDFTIPSEEKAAFDKLLATLGMSLSRINSQAAMKQLATARKFGYSLTLRDFISVAPTKAAELKVAVTDVPTTFTKVIEAIAKAKGHVGDQKLNEQDKLHVTAQIAFSVPIEEKATMDKLLDSLGSVLSRSKVQAPANQLATAKKFGYSLDLRDYTSIPASKAFIDIIAVTDVPGNYTKILDAITKVKGQVTDAKLNEQDKLNINAQLDFSVMSEEKQAIDFLLKEIGVTMSHTNVQAPMNQLSTDKKVGYVLVLRDLATIPPSKAIDLKVAVIDVPASYTKFLDAINKVKGHIVDSKLNEQDMFHVTAQLTFSVANEDKADIDKLLVEVGTVLSRKNDQAPVNQLSNPKKFGYSLDLRDFAKIPPSHASAVTIATSNVPTNYAKLIDAIAKAKGLVADAKLDEQDKLNVTGQVTFTVPSAGKVAIEKLLLEMGTGLSRKNEQAPVTVLSTDGKFGYSVSLRDFASIPPRETFILQIAMNDVPATFREFQEAVAQAKGWVNVGKLIEDNKAKIEAQLNFDVPAAEKGAIEKLLAKTGAIIQRTSSQVPVNNLATDQKVGYQLSLRSTASIGPREKTQIKFEVSDVDSKLVDLKEIALAGKGRVVDSSVDRHENGQVTAAVVFEVPFASQDSLIRQMKSAGKLVSQRTTRDPKVTENELTTAHIIVTLTTDPFIPNDKGVGSYVRTSLNLSFNILATIVMTIIVGLSALLPVAILIWLGFKLYYVMSGPNQGQPTLAPAGGSKLIADDDKPGDGDAGTKL